MSDESVTAENVFDEIVRFFASRAGDSAADGKECKLTSCPSLLQIACMGNAERAVQGELLFFLRAQGIFAVSEGGFRQVNTDPKPKFLDRHIDIIVMSNATGAGKPIVAIELKHYSPHQGIVEPLRIGLDADFDKSQPVMGQGVALIQVGVYTQVSDIVPPPIGNFQNDFAFYRFISAYVLKRIPHKYVTNIAVNQSDFSKWPKMTSGRYRRSTAGLVQGCPQEFVIPAVPNSYTVKGRTNYFVGLC